MNGNWYTSKEESRSARGIVEASERRYVYACMLLDIAEYLDVQRTEQFAVWEHYRGMRSRGVPHGWALQRAKSKQVGLGERG